MFKGLCAIVLILAKTQSFFFKVAGMGLSFGFLTKTVLITEGCFCYCKAALTQSMSFLLVTPPQQQSRLGVHKDLGGDTITTADLHTKGISHTIWHHTQYIKDYDHQLKQRK